MQNITGIKDGAAESQAHEVELVHGVASKDEASFRELMALYQDRIRAFASVYAVRINDHVDDIAQDIFLQIYLSAKKFKGDSSVKTWIYSIAKYTINNKLRKKKLTYFWQFWKKNDQGEMDDSLISDDNPELALLSYESKRDVRASIAGLDANSQEVLMLYEWSGLSYEQIGKTLNINVGTVKSRLNHARKKLKDNFLGECEGYAREKK